MFLPKLITKIKSKFSGDIFDNTMCAGENIIHIKGSNILDILQLINIILINNEFQNDNVGPVISLYQNNAKIDNESIVNKNFPIKIVIEDEQGINLMSGFQHDIR